VGDIRLLVSNDLAENTRHLTVDVGKFLFFFRHLKADADLWNGIRVGRGFPKVAD
jgi:hypothetical protein